CAVSDPPTSATISWFSSGFGGDAPSGSRLGTPLTRDSPAPYGRSCSNKSDQSSSKRSTTSSAGEDSDHEAEQRTTCGRGGRGGAGRDSARRLRGRSAAGRGP